MTIYQLHLEADKSSAYAIADALSDWEAYGPPTTSLFETAPDIWTVDAYFEDNPNDKVVKTFLAAHLTEALRAKLTLAPVVEEDWVAKSQQGLKPVEAGRFIIHGSHDADDFTNHKNAIEVDAGQAFGTAHHGTTKGCLIAIDELCQKQSFSQILDMGTGTGVLAIACAQLLPKAEILATDLDPIAIDVASDNAKINNEAEKIDFAVAPGTDDQAIQQRAPFDLVIANILAGPLIDLAPNIATISGTGSALILSGLLDEQAQKICERYQSVGYSVKKQASLEGWTTLQLERN